MEDAIILKDSQCEKITLKSKTVASLAISGLLAQIQGWEIVELKHPTLQRFISIDQFLVVSEVIYQIIDLTTQEQHHPHVTFGSNYIIITLFTASISNLHTNDFVMAHKINAIIKEIASHA